jgi:hypothetical protein
MRNGIVIEFSFESYQAREMTGDVEATSRCQMFSFIVVHDFGRWTSALIVQTATS